MMTQAATTTKTFFNLKSSRAAAIQTLGMLEARTENITDILEYISSPETIKKAGKWTYNNPMKAAVAVTGAAGLTYLAGPALIGTSIFCNTNLYSISASYLGWKIFQRTSAGYLTKATDHLYWRKEGEPMISRKLSLSSAFRSAISKTILTDIYHVPKKLIKNIKLAGSHIGGLKRTLQTGDPGEWARVHMYGIIKSTIKAGIGTAAKLALGSLGLPTPPFLD